MSKILWNVKIPYRSTLEIEVETSGDFPNVDIVNEVMQRKGLQTKEGVKEINLWGMSITRKEVTNAK